jgi:thymidine phosphorylase
VNPLSLAHLVHRLGGGRSHPTDRIDPYVGIELYKKKGDQVAEGEVLAQLFYSKAKSDHSPQSIAHDFESAFEIVDGFGAPTSWIGEVIE